MDGGELVAGMDGPSVPEDGPGLEAGGALGVKILLLRGARRYLSDQRHSIDI